MLEKNEVKEKVMEILFKKVVLKENGYFKTIGGFPCGLREAVTRWVGKYWISSLKHIQSGPSLRKQENEKVADTTQAQHGIFSSPGGFRRISTDSATPKDTFFFDKNCCVVLGEVTMGFRTPFKGTRYAVLSTTVKLRKEPGCPSMNG